PLPQRHEGQAQPYHSHPHSLRPRTRRRFVTHKLSIPFLIHRDDLAMLESMQSRIRQFMGFEVPPPPKVDAFLKDGDSLGMGDETIHVLHTPGHSPGSISLTADGYVFTGDALFNQSIV